MPKSLVIVESPAKAKTINRYLGPGYAVKASMGHIRDLPRKKLGVDIAHDFAPQYEVIPEKKKVVADLKKAAENSEDIFLAADPDREGEAISWHLRTLLEGTKKNFYRVLLQEITRKAVEEAFRNKGDLDQNRFQAQQTRRILDRLVGYLISPLLWKKIGKGLSAGRVQSVALRLICEREREIRGFVSEEYWSIAAQLEASSPPPFKASLVKIEGIKVKLENEKQAADAVAELRQSPFVLEKITVQEKKKTPPPPYITSTLQQDCFRLLHFPVRRTMSIAQKLYEGLPVGERGPVGLITYMRTDSVRVSPLALSWARKYIEATYSPRHLPPKARIYTNKRKAQDAHEAIRPTSADLPPAVVKPFLKKDEYSVYELIWNRFLASQMSAALIEETEFDIRASRYEFKAKGEVQKWEGYLILQANQKKEEERLPVAREGEILRLLDLESKQNFTQPPPRYTEGTLVRELEAKGIGRPSTYAPIISTLQDRVYVIKEKGKFVPTDLGMFVTDFLVKNFPDVMEVKFTARMEEELDRIGEGQLDWLESLRKFHVVLERDLEQTMAKEGVRKTGIPLEEKCPRCSRPLVIKDGRYGRFKACSGYPECGFKESLFKKEAAPLEEKCPKCGSPLVLRRGKYGTFAACSNYPRCTFIKKDAIDTGLSCPLACGGTLIRRKTRRGKIFFGCSRFPQCRFASWDKPLSKSCPKCGQKVMLLKSPKKGEPYFYCPDEKCGYREPIKKEEIPGQEDISAPASKAAPAKVDEKRT